MPRVMVTTFSISIDGYCAGPDQDLAHPLGRGGEALHDWMTPTETFQGLSGQSGTTGIDEDFAKRSFDNVGAWIMGRNMFGPVRGAWPDESWRGWWGETPPFHTPVFVLTHHERPQLKMDGGTVFHFVTGGVRAALYQAREAAAGKDVRVGGGVATVRQYLEAGLIDEMHLAVAPVLLGRGESLFEGIDLPALGFRVAERVSTDKATHVVLRKVA